MEWESDSPCRNHTYAGQEWRSTGRFDPGSIPGSGRSPGEGNGNPLQYSGLEDPHGWRSLVGYSPQGHKESDTTERLHFHRAGPHPGCPLQWLMYQTTEQDPTQGGPLSAWSLNNREGPQARDPSKCLNRRRYEERLAKEAPWAPATRGWKKASDQAITPAAEAVCVPAHLAPPRSPQSRQLHHLHAQPSLGQSCHRQKKMSCVHAHRISLVLSDSLRPCRLWPARLLCQRGGSPDRNTGTYWPILVAVPS